MALVTPSRHPIVELETRVKLGLLCHALLAVDTHPCCDSMIETATR
jgi:hypothetical protein